MVPTRPPMFDRVADDERLTSRSGGIYTFVDIKDGCRRSKEKVNRGSVNNTRGRLRHLELELGSMGHTL